MSLIVISAADKDVERTIAKRIAEAVGYECLGPEQLPEIAAEYHVTEDNLAAALEKAPATGISRRTKRLPHWLACIEAGVLSRLESDNMVCWGLAAHLYVQGISHALRVRLLVDQEQLAERIAISQKISTAKAKRTLTTARRKRDKWTLAAFNQDEQDPALYDLVINLTQIDSDEAVDTVVKAIGYRKFKAMTYSRQSLADLALAAKVKATLSESLTDFRVQARSGRVVVTCKALKRERQKKTAVIKEITGALPGVQYVEVRLINYVIRQAAESFG